MHNIIADFQFTEIVDPATGVLFLCLAFSLFSEDIRIGKNHETDPVKNIALTHMAVTGHDFSAFQYPVRILRIKRVHSLFGNALRQTFGPGL